MIRIIICSFLLLTSCTDSNQFTYEYDNTETLKKYSKNVIEAGFFSLPEGDYRGGGRIFYRKDHSFIEVRLIVDGKDTFLSLPIKERLTSHKWDFSGNGANDFFETASYKTTKSLITRNWSIQLQEPFGDVEYLAKKEGKRVFSIKLPRVDRVGYRVSVGKIGSEMEIIYFDTLQYPEGQRTAIEQKAVFSYVLIKSE